jgi:hypothetical protein
MNKSEVSVRNNHSIFVSTAKCNSKKQIIIFDIGLCKIKIFLKMPFFSVLYAKSKSKQNCEFNVVPFPACKFCPFFLMAKEHQAWV